MSNKVTNIYIDTTGFCDKAIERVKKALDAIVDYNKMGNVLPANAVFPARRVAIYFNGQGCWCYTSPTSPILGNKKSVGLWELESIAFRCKQEKKEEIPTRNIYIDASELTLEDRIQAFRAINYLKASGRQISSNIANDIDFFSSDIYAIDHVGNRRFNFKKYACYAQMLLDGYKELTFDQLMSLVR